MHARSSGHAQIRSSARFPFRGTASAQSNLSGLEPERVVMHRSAGRSLSRKHTHNHHTYAHARSHTHGRQRTYMYVLYLHAHTAYKLLILSDMALQPPPFNPDTLYANMCVYLNVYAIDLALSILQQSQLSRVYT